MHVVIIDYKGDKYLRYCKARARAHARPARNIANVARQTRVAFRQEPQTTFRSYETIPLKFQARSTVVPLAREFLIDLQDARRTFARHSIDSGDLSLVYRHAAECDSRDASCVLYLRY